MSARGSIVGTGVFELANRYVDAGLYSGELDKLIDVDAHTRELAQVINDAIEDWFEENKPGVRT